MSNESLKHLKLKQQGIKILKNMGFKDDEIFLEKFIITNGRRGFQPDVLGDNGKIKIAVECGTFDTFKLKRYKPYFDKVIHLPYFHSTLKYKGSKESLKTIKEKKMMYKLMNKYNVKVEE